MPVHPTDRKISRPGGLAERLYRMRKAAGLTGDDLTRLAGWGAAGRTKISKIENGRQLPSRADINAWTAACGQPGAAGELLDLLADVQAVHRQWRGRLRRGHAPVQEEWDRRVRAAKRFRAVVPVMIPGLLQTAGYARAIMTQVADLWGTADVDAAVEARMRRQEVLYDQSKTFEFVITEAALRLLPCPRQVMAGQLDRLLSMDLPNVTLGIIPMGTPLAVSPFNNFDLLDDRVIVESHGAEDEPGEDESAVYARLFDSLMAEAVTGEEARRLITGAVDDLRRHAG
jgi:transcriptional regulator with XRE-family HTH domain